MRKQTLFEQLNAIPLERISNRAAKWGVLGALIGAAVTLILSRVCTDFFNFADYKLEAVFLFSVVVALWFGFFSISAYYVARKVEENTRDPIRNFIQFLKYVNDILAKDDSPTYLFMVYYPNFRLDKRVGDEIGNDVNDKLDLLLGKDKKLTLVIPCKSYREKFFDSFPTGTVNAAVLADERKNRTRLKDLAGRNAEIKYFKFDNPLHIFISERELVWGTVGAPTTCTGFYSKDAEIRDAFVNLFNILKGQSTNEDR